MTAIEIIAVVTADGHIPMTEERCKQAMKESCFKVWCEFNLGNDQQFELWWRFNME